MRHISKAFPAKYGSYDLVAPTSSPMLKGYLFLAVCLGRPRLRSCQARHSPDPGLTLYGPGCLFLTLPSSSLTVLCAAPLIGRHVFCQCVSWLPHPPPPSAAPPAVVAMANCTTMAVNLWCWCYSAGRNKRGPVYAMEGGREEKEV